MHQSAQPTGTSSGLLLNKCGGHAVNWGSLPFLTLATSATLWLMWRRRGEPAPALAKVAD